MQASRLLPRNSTKTAKAFLTELRTLDRQRDMRLSAPELKAVLAALGGRDETAEICRNKEGEAEPDTDLRDKVGFLRRVFDMVYLSSAAKAMVVAARRARSLANKSPT